MNNRIKELAEQCRTITDYGMGKYEKFDDVNFAELIVRECAKLADDTPGEYLLQPYHYPSTYILEQFGVV